MMICPSQNEAAADSVQPESKIRKIKTDLKWPDFYFLTENLIILAD